METILLIEDNENILENLTEYFELEGYNMLVVNNGRSGVEMARTFVPDLIICDVLMNDIDGHEVLRLLLEDPITYEIPFIFSTSNSQKVDRATSLALGADDYIIKPFELDELLAMSKKWLLSGSVRHRESKE